MTTKPYTKQDYEKLKRFSLKLRLIAVASTCVVILCIGLIFRHFALERERMEQEELERFAERERLRLKQLAEQERQFELQAERIRRYSDSVRIANMPTYTNEDVYNLVRTKVPSYSWVYMWRKDKDDWIMSYKLEYDDKERWFYQRFNPTTRKFDKAIEYSTVHYKNLDDDKGIYTFPKNSRYKFIKERYTKDLRFYEDEELVGIYSQDEVGYKYSLPPTSHGPLTKKRIEALRNTPPEWKVEGYESAEDWYYDNEEDLRSYYGR